MIHDPISDFLTRIRNASLLHSEFVIISFSKFTCSILEILKLEKVIKNFKLFKLRVNFFILILLSYTTHLKCSVIKRLTRVSKSSLMFYTNKSYKFLGKTILGASRSFYVISTSYGLMTNHTAKKLALGGEVLFEISVFTSFFV